MRTLGLCVARLSAMTDILDKGAKSTKIIKTMVWSDVDRAVDRYVDNVGMEIM